MSNLTVTKIKGKSLTKKVKEEILKQFPSFTSLEKKHIDCVGYVFFIYRNETIIGKIFKEGLDIVIYNDNR